MRFGCIEFPRDGEPVVVEGPLGGSPLFRLRRLVASVPSSRVGIMSLRALSGAPVAPRSSDVDDGEALFGSTRGEAAFVASGAASTEPSSRGECNAPLPKLAADHSGAAAAPPGGGGAGSSKDAGRNSDDDRRWRGRRWLLSVTDRR